MSEYLTYDEFKALGGDLDKEVFNNLITKAQTAIAGLTSHFYDTPEALNTDTIVFRRKRYKEALAYQVTYYNDIKATTAAQLDGKPTSQSIGDTSVTYGSKDTSAKSVVPIAPEVLSALEDTGLLYKGAILWRHC